MIVVFKNRLPLIYQKRNKMKTLLLIFVAACFASCGSSSYSPLDTYLKARMEGDSLNEKSRIEAQKFIDSTNNAHIVIHLRQKY